VPQRLDTSLAHRDALKLWFLAGFGALIFSVFFLTPALRPSSLLAIVNVLILSTPVQFMERRGISRTWASLILLVLGGFLVGLCVTVGASGFGAQWNALSSQLPQIQSGLARKAEAFRSHISIAVGFSLPINVEAQLLSVLNLIQKRTFAVAPEFASSLLGALFFAPVFTFFLLKDSRSLKKLVIQLIPNRYFESLMVIGTRAGATLFMYLQAKLLEALVVGALVFLGLSIIGAPYAFLFGLIAGITNVLPYIGPVLGAIPALVVVGVSRDSSHLLGLSALVFAAVNFIDAIYIFPVFVARWVNLSPLTLLASVAVGQVLYGVTGMLIAVPIAACIKIIFQETVRTLYNERIE
jgi:putative permease